MVPSQFKQVSKRAKMCFRTVMKAKVAYKKHISAYLIVILISTAAWHYLGISWSKSYSVNVGIGKVKDFVARNYVHVHESRGLAETGKHMNRFLTILYYYSLCKHMV